MSGHPVDNPPENPIARGFHLDVAMAELPLFIFGTKWSGWRPQYAEYRIDFCGRESKFTVGANDGLWIPSSFDKSVYVAVKTIIESGSAVEDREGFQVVRTSQVVNMLRLSKGWNANDSVRASAVRIANTDYGVECANGEFEYFRLFMRFRYSDGKFFVILHDSSECFAERKIPIDWASYSRLPTHSVRRMYEILRYEESKRDEVSFKYSDMVSAFPLNSGKMNKVYIKKMAGELVEAGLVESFDAASDPKRISFRFKRSERSRASRSPSVREKSDRSRRIDRSSYTVDSEIPKSDVFLRRALLEVYGHRCFYTKDPITLDTLTVDHVVPVSSGGADCISNYVPVTKTANSRKNAHYSPEDSAELRAIVRAVYAGKVLAKYLALRKDFYSSPWDAAKTAVTSMFSKTY